ncbi:hypothetical protein D9M70_608800 [compost metagenome]
MAVVTGHSTFRATSTTPSTSTSTAEPISATRAVAVMAKLVRLRRAAAMPTMPIATTACSIAARNDSVMARRAEASLATR